MDTDLLFEFLRNTQPEEIETLEKVHKNNFKETFLNFLNLEIEQH